MILLEYIIAQHQDANVSVAIKSRKTRQHNPAIFISRSRRRIIWEFRGLHLGEIENITGEPRVTRIDFYIGLEDLIEQRTNFLTTTGTPIGNIHGLRIPVGTERRGGKKIRWKGPLGRIQIVDVSATIPPFKIAKNDSSQLLLNIDKETSPYPIMSDQGNRTTKELHFGIEHNYGVVQDGRIRTARIQIVMTENQYATVLSFIDTGIKFYNNI